jgi:glutamate-5-semialdehyde dehydrogenase
VLRAAYEEAGLPADALVLVEDTSREAAVEFMRQRGAIDVLIPRGGPSLIQSILDNATVPYVIDGDGNCHVYVDESARPGDGGPHRHQRQDPAAVGVQRRRDAAGAQGGGRGVPGGIDDVLPGVELVADTATLGLLPDSVGATEATDEDWAQEFLDLKMAVKVVGSIDDAIDHIARFTSGHSEAIVTAERCAAARPLHGREVDAAPW